MTETGTKSGAKPPVAEVALSIELAGAPALAGPEYAPLWDAIRERYPRIEEQHPLGSISESLGARVRTGVQVELVREVQSPRLWLLDAGGERLVQLQQNRVGVNWRRLREEATYPSYVDVRDELRRVVDCLRTFYVGHGASPTPTHCEVTYVDNVFLGGEGGPTTLGDLGKLLSFWSDGPVSGSLGTPQDASCVVRYPVQGPGLSRGTLRFEVGPAIRRTDRVALMMMQTVIQAELAQASWEALWVGLDTAHSLAGKVFLEATRAEMHRQWRLAR